MTVQRKSTHPFEEYVFQARVEEDGGYYLGIPRLPGCMAAGGTIGEAVDNLKTAFEEWTAHVLAQGGEVPAPIDEADYSGKVLLRMPKWLHAAAAARGSEAGVSLNTLLVAYVAEGLGESSAWPATEAVHALEGQVSVLQGRVEDIHASLAAIGRAVVSGAEIARED